MRRGVDLPKAGTAFTLGPPLLNEHHANGCFYAYGLSGELQKTRSGVNTEATDGTGFLVGDEHPATSGLHGKAPGNLAFRGDEANVPELRGTAIERENRKGVATSIRRVDDVPVGV